MHGNTRYRNSIVFSSFVWPASQDLLCCFWYNDWSACLSKEAIFLQAIRTHYPHYGDMTAGKEELRRQHLDQWKDAEHRIQSVLQAAANSAYKAKKITEESWRQHFMSGWFFWHFISSSARKKSKVSKWAVSSLFVWRLESFASCWSCEAGSWFLDAG